ncbi:MAG: hypothetical protein A2007_06520 [Verrucomicrobia bacterium GWC2_42_7]|nr:MAG: hypothetical protein A2007_06520 [Verrucomicrobia bacterium GWC2_42_7]
MKTESSLFAKAGEGSSQRFFRFHLLLIDSLRNYSWPKFESDIFAGIIVGIIAMPLSMAFGMAAGLTPATGLFTAIIASFVAAIFGGSKFQVSGPSATFAVIAYSVVDQYGGDKIFLCTLLAGVFLLIMAFSGVGRVIKYIPYPVTMAFISGIAVVLFSSQVRDFLGLPIEKLPADTMAQISIYSRCLHEFNLYSLGTGCLTLGVLLFWPKKFAPKIPVSLIGLAIPTLIIYLFNLPVPRIIDRFSEGIPQCFPSFALPEISLEWIKVLSLPALTIAIIISIESLLSALVVDSLSDEKHDSDQELFGQGLGNVIASLFGCIPSTGAIARTATNFRNGAKSPVSSIIHAITLLLIVFIAAPFANLIPLASLSAILIVVAINMGEWNEFLRFKKTPPSDFIVFLTVFVLTIVAGITVAMEVGLVLASLLFIKRVSDTSGIAGLEQLEPTSHHEGTSLSQFELPPGAQAFRIQGVFFFGTADKLETALRRSQQDTRVMILILDQVLDLDASGLNALESLYERLKRTNSHLIICNVHKKALRVLLRSGFVELIGRENLCPSLEKASERAKLFCN